MKPIRRISGFRQRLPLVLAGWLIGAGSIGAATAAAPGGVDALIDQAKAAKSGDDFLSPDQAFRFDASAPDSRHIQLVWNIAKGYYLYRDRIKVAATDDAVKLDAPQFPDGITKDDPYFGKQVIYHDRLIVPVGVTLSATGARTVTVKVSYQGCAQAGLCYPPQTHEIALTLPAAASGAATPPAGGAPTGGAGSEASAAGAAAGGGVYVSRQQQLAELLRTGSLIKVLLTFFGSGLLLAFTPCVLPMVPILSGLIVGQGPQVTTARAFSLSVTYVLGMAITYTVTGALCAAAGKQVQAAFQQPWIIGLFAALFVAMALSMFGLFTLQMPSFIQTRVSSMSNRQRSGSFGGVAIMGALSALIVTTCVGPVLVAALVVIGQTGDMVRGASALFVMALGMGAPLLVVGSSAGRWLPRAGGWMDSVKRLFGAMMLALAAWMLDRIIPARFSLLLFAIPTLAVAAVLWTFVPVRAGRQATSARAPSTAVARLAAVGVAAYAVLLVIGTTRGSDDLMHPLSARRAADAEPAFIRVVSVADLQREVSAAVAAHQPVMLDFYADWCTSCKEMQRFTFTDPKVREALKTMRLLRADVTQNNADDQALLQQFKIFGPPTIAFYDAQGHEHEEYTVVGYLKADDFADVLHRALTSG
ncbi:MAG TPA: protein-disulfide reductase DsbD [Steroidobacteraceae bacterium]|jgi:thiol:disulfide interchange protein DsbD|nr:protein-disulfide reductase DsbD [Steroidobacteraceae bacterium]